MNIHLDSDMLSAVTSVFAVLISIISLAFSIVFSRLQIKHNINSVKPISDIQVKDYEDKISVGIVNVGTGPLLITKFNAKRDGKSYKNLISMMPAINQNWRTFMKTIENRTIPVGGEFILIELNPQNELDKIKVRNSLSDITIYLEYTDIYSTKFEDKKKLDFFGRHNYKSKMLNFIIDDNQKGS